MKTDYDLLQNLRFGASVFVGQNKNDSYLSDTDVFTNPSRYTRTVNPYLNAYNPDGSYAYDPDMTVNTGNTDVLDFNFLEERARTEYTLKTRSIKTIFDLDYRPVKGLKLYTQFGLQVDNSATEKMAQENTYFTRKYQLKSMVDQVVRLPKGGHLGQTEGKGRAHQPHCAAHQHRQSHPRAERPQVTVLPMMKPSQLAGEKHRKPLLNGAKSYGIGSL